MSNLFIVESPAKIQKIEAALGSDFKGIASYGHIIDLPAKAMNIDIANKFEPHYDKNPDKLAKIKEIIKAIKKADTIYLAADEDREGEMIAWSIKWIAEQEDPKLYEKKVKNAKRMLFNSVTKSALQDAIKNATEVNMNVVHAQQARRVLDRIVGYEISPLLFGMGKGTRSAGRVQSVVARLIVDRENEINNFIKSGLCDYYKFNGRFKCNKAELKAVLYDREAEEESENDDSESNTKKKKGKKASKDDDDGSEESEKPKKKKSKKSKKDDDDDDDDDDKSEEVDEDEGSEEELDKKKSKKEGSKKESKKESTKETKKSKKSRVAIAKVKSQDGAMKIMEKIKKSKFAIDDINEKERRQNPMAPFTTSTLQQEGFKKFSFDTKRTMQVAQRLYEAGYITYMRTDSTNLSEEAIQNIKKYILETYSKKDYEMREYKTKSKTAQEAHEACRATDVFKVDIEGSSDEKKLYKLIWKRTVASQMKAAIYDVLELVLSISKLDRYFFKTAQEVLKYAGFLQVYNIKDVEVDDDQEEDNDTKIKKPEMGDEIKVIDVKAINEFKRPPVRYDQASLVKILDPDHLGIVRPATGSAAISKILDRGYVEIKDSKGISKEITNLLWDGGDDIIEEKTNTVIGAYKKKFVPTDLGVKINTILVDNFPLIMDFKFTAHMEEELSAIASGDKVWYRVLKTFYKEFHPLVEQMKELRKTYKADIRIIGKYNDIEIQLLTDRATPLIRYGGDGKKGATFCEVDCSIDELTEDYAIKLLKNKMSFPKTLGEYKDKDVVLHEGRFGPYLKYGTLNISTPDKTTDIDLDAAIELIKTKIDSNMLTFDHEGATYSVLKGMYGPYVRVAFDDKTKKNKNVTIPKDKDPKELTKDEIIELVANYTPSNRFKKKDAGDDKEAKEDKPKVKAKPKKRLVKKATE
jgi:DNA topoisomerase-1